MFVTVGFCSTVFVCCLLVRVPLRFRCFFIRISSELFDSWLFPFD